MKSPKCLVFRGPAHHSQLLRPVELELEKAGWEIVRYTADTEACFQVPLQEECGDGWLWLPDYDAPADSLRLYQQHVPYFREQLATPKPLSLMTPQVLDRIVHFICREWVSTRNLLKAVQPTACLALHELNRWGMMLGALSQRRQIPFWTLQEGMYYGLPWIYTGHVKYSQSFIWGQATKDKLLAAGCAEDRLHVIGHPDLEQRWQKAEREVKDGLLTAELPVAAQGKRLALVFMGMLDIGRGRPPLAEGLGDSEWFVVGRCHQMSSAPNIEKLQVLFQQPGLWLSMAGGPAGFAHHWRLMAAAEIFLLVGCSTSAIEWGWRGKPMGNIRVPRQLFDFVEAGVAVDVSELPLLPALQKVETAWPEGQYAEKMRAFVAREVTHGSAGPRIAEYIQGKQTIEGRRS